MASAVPVPAARTPVPAVEPAEQPSGLPRGRPRASDPDSERAHYEGFVALAARDGMPDAAEVLRADGPAYRKVAFLRALLDTDSPELAGACELAVAELPLESDARGVSVPEYAVRLLGGAAAGRPERLAALHRMVFGASRTRDAGLRARAAKALLEAADAEALRRVSAELHAVEDPDLLRVVADALTRGALEPNMSFLFADLALPPVPAEEHE